MTKNIAGPLQNPNGITQSPFLAKMAKTVKIIIFLRIQALTNYKVSEKSYERFPRKSVTDGRTNEWTDVTPKVSTTS